MPWSMGRWEKCVLARDPLKKWNKMEKILWEILFAWNRWIWTIYQVYPFGNFAWDWIRGERSGHSEHVYKGWETRTTSLSRCVPSFRRGLQARPFSSIFSVFPTRSWNLKKGKLFSWVVLTCFSTNASLSAPFFSTPWHVSKVHLH